MKPADQKNTAQKKTRPNTTSSAVKTSQKSGGNEVLNSLAWNEQWINFYELFSGHSQRPVRDRQKLK